MRKEPGKQQAENAELFSVIVLCYRHFEYIYSAIDSVLAQDYPLIELIVSDDGSANFPRGEIADYIAEHRRGNIRRVLVRQQPENTGTVRHLNSAVKACTGSYIIALAGDDNLYDRHTLENYKAGFDAAPKRCLIEMAQTGMYDETLETLQEYYVKPIVQEALEKSETDTGDLLRLLIKHGAILPSTSTCFRADFFREFGQFDESYTLVEDYPMHVRLAEEGWPIHYCNFVAIKHRSGGISHGQQDTLKRSSRLYYIDDRRMIREIMLKRLNVLPESERAYVKKYREQNLLWLDMNLASMDGNRTRQLEIAMAHPLLTLERLMGLAWPWACVKRSKMLWVFLTLWLFRPVVAEMVERIIPSAGPAMSIALFALAGIAFVLWVAAMIVWVFNKVSWAIRRFPQETLAIG